MELRGFLCPENGGGILLEFVDLAFKFSLGRLEYLQFLFILLLIDISILDICCQLLRPDWSL